MRVIELSIFTILCINSVHSKTKLPDYTITYLEEALDEVAEDPCAGLTYCTAKPKDYPQEKFNDMFKNFKVLPQPSSTPDIKFVNRLGDEQEQDNCETKIEYAPLYKVREKREEPWRYAIQVPAINFTQTVRMETCVNPDKECFTAYPKRMEYQTGCKQKYITWNVLVLNDKNKTEVISPTLPVCCSCHYKPLSFTDRFGRR